MKKYIFFVFIICVTAGLLILIKDDIGFFLNSPEGKKVEIIKTVPISNYFSVNGTATNLIVVGNNYMHGFSNHGNENFDFNVSLKDAVTDAQGEYCIIGEKEGSKIYMINTNAKIWENDIQGTILNVSVNKNGYSAIIYKQVGYKSLVKVLKPDGTELFTTYLASAYAIDAEISNDNKELAIAEVNTEGIKIDSIIELINMTDLELKNKRKIDLEDDTLIVNIEYDSKNRLLIQTDKKIQIVKDVNKLTDIVSYNGNTQIAMIENGNNPMVIEKNETGLFDTNHVLKIHNYKEEEIDFQEFQMDKSPTYITSKNDKVVMMLEKELMVVNINGKLVKNYETSGNIKSLLIFNNGNTLALIYRDKIEFVRI